MQDPEFRGLDDDLKRPGKSRPTVFDLIQILFAWRRFIVINVLVASTLGVIVSLVLPEWYKAKASLLQPKENDILSSFGMAGSVLRGIGGGPSAIRALGGGEGGYSIFAILNSRTALEAAVRKFDLMRVFEVHDSSMEKAVKILTGNVSFEEGNNDEITIEVIDRDPRRAAAMANYFVDILNEMNTRLGTQEARNNREFIERQVEKERLLLTSVEDSLQRFQERAGTIITPDQAGALAPLAELYATKAKREIELSVMRRQMSSDDAVVQQKLVELSELDRKLSTFPGLGIQSLRLYREVLIHQKILEYLMPMLEQARIDEQKDIPVLLVLDWAIVPEKRFRPQRTLIVFLVSSLTLLGSCLLALPLHRFERVSASEDSFAAGTRWIVKRIARLYGVR